MFSPDAAVTASVAARNPRRRQRTGSEDSVATRHNPKRIRRSGLSAQTFQPQDATKHSDLTEHISEQPIANGHAKEPRSRRHTSVEATSLAIRHRGVKKADRERRTSRNDGSIELTRNENYVITQLATTPESLQDHHTSGRWQGELSPPLGYALAMTQSQAIVWRYTQGTSSTETSKPTIINLPYPSNNAHNPLPLGILVPTSAEPALLVVMPTSGKITYWESLSSAASADSTRQKQQGVQGVVSGLMSTEIITKITEAEPRGFVLSMSTGRLAHLIVSEPQGKPSMNISFLRDNGASSGGVFGSLRNVFSSAGWRKDVAAVRAGDSSQRGQRYVVVATIHGTFQVWDLNWNGTHTLISDVNAQGDLLQALGEADNAVSKQVDSVFEILDFTVLSRRISGKEVAKANQTSECCLMVLTALKGNEASSYALIGVTLSHGLANVDVVHPITCYKASMSAESSFRPQVLVPETSQTAFVIFEKNLCLVSLAEVDETPSSQLQMEAHTLPDPFQDAIDFCKTKPYRVIGCASETYDRAHAQSSCLVMIYGFGVIRIAALPLKEGQSALQRATITAKTKIEQAVFFGSLQQNLLDFTPRPENHFSTAEIEAAALNVSHSIMSSTSTYIPAISPSMDQQLQRRSIALADLNKHLRRHYSNVLSRLTKWKLLWNAEKMESAKAIWRCYNIAINNQHGDTDNRNLLVELIEALSEQVKTENQPEHHETDGVRHWFIHDIWRLEYILPWAQNMVELLFQESVEDSQQISVATQARLVSEANDIQLAGLETAFRFREANIASYGLESEVLSDGVLQSGYEELPQIWTSTAAIVEHVKLLTDVSRELTKLNEDVEGREGEPAPDLVLKLAGENPRQVQICCQTYIERSRWLMSRADPKSVAAGEDLMEAHFKVRKALFQGLLVVGQPDMGIKLAEKYHDMEALVDIIDEELESAESDEFVQMYEASIRSYFTKFGKSWSDAYFQKHLDASNAVEVLNNNADFKPHLTKFLRSHPAYAKLSWINEVVSETNYLAASDTLKVAGRQDANLWSKKIDLSMSKLSLMAATSKGQVKDDFAVTTLRKIDQNTAVFGIQEALYNSIKSSITDALDAEAETDMAMQTYGIKSVKDKPMLRNTLEKQLRKLLAMEALSSKDLIDVLTLVHSEDDHANGEGVMILRFFSAFRVLRLADLEASDPGLKELLERIIWRRCMIQDDWEESNRTEEKDDIQVELQTSGTSLFKTLREGYRTGFWDKHAPLSPSSVVEAGTSIKALKISSHFANIPDNALELLARDLEAEAEILDGYIVKGRLEEWWKGVVDAAKASARAEADALGEARMKKRNEEIAFDRRLSAIDKENLQKGKDKPRAVDAQGDVLMAV